MFIDPHVHCRDGRQAHKETISHALSVAERAGVDAIFDMPNTDPPVTTEERVIGRLALAEQAKSSVFYGAYMALTSDKKQIVHAVETYDKIPEVVGFKLYAGHSVGDIGVIVEAEQRGIYATLAECGYKGVVTLHCEKESLLRPELWNPAKPITHALARPPEAEVASVRGQIEFAQDAVFKGTLHIAHISVPEAVGAVQAAKSLRVTCGVTPHHLLLNAERMNAPDGLLYKMNPPLRTEEMRAQMLSLLREGSIDWIETDHAPHALDEKLNQPHMSGIPALPFYPKLARILKEKGFSEKQIEDIAFNNVKRAFGATRPAIRNIPLSCRELDFSLAKEYPFDPFAGFQ